MRAAALLKLGRMKTPRLDALDTQRGDVGALVVVFQAEYMAVVRHKAAFVIDHLVGQATGLAAFAPVGAAPGVRGADVTLAAVGHAQRAMDKKLQRAAGGVGGGADGGDLRQVQFARQHHLAKTHVLQKPGFFGRADVALGAGVQLDRRQVNF